MRDELGWRDLEEDEGNQGRRGSVILLQSNVGCMFYMWATQAVILEL